MSVHFDKLEVKELSLVKKGANKEKQWLLYKSEDPPKDVINDLLLASDLEVLASMMKNMHEHITRMMAKVGKKDYKYPYPDAEKEKKASEDVLAKKKKEDEEEEMARKKKKEEEEEMARLKTQVQELSEFKKIVDELVPSLQNQIEDMNPEAILAEAKKM